jgi:hypothetical protein
MLTTARGLRQRAALLFEMAILISDPVEAERTRSLAKRYQDEADQFEADKPLKE